MANHLKDKSIKIFSLNNVKQSSGFITTIKRYIHPKESFLWAYFRDLSSSEIQANQQNQDETVALFIINRRLVKKDMYVEYNRKEFGNVVYQITGIDGWDDTTREITLRVKKINSKIEFSEVEDTKWA